MKSTRLLILLAVVINVAVVAFLLLRPTGGGTAPKSLAEAARPLTEDATLDASRYDLRSRANELDVVLISLDALRYDHTGLGGDGAGLTPNLDRFAEEAVVFHRATSVAPWTLPSHMSMWTGRWPSVHGVTNKLRLLSQDQLVPTQLSPGIETFPDHLIRAGWTAAAFTGGAGVQASYGFGRNFATYLDDKPFTGFERTVPAALAWLKEHPVGRNFVFLHGYDVHGQHDLEGIKPRDALPEYKGSLDGSVEEQAKLREQGLAAIAKPGDPPNLVLPPEDVRFLEQIYELKVKQADERVGRFLDELRSTGRLDRTVVAVVSDHGDEFLEHGYVDHGATLCEHQLHTVMMIRFPGYARRQDVRAPVRSFDIFPTIFDALGLSGPSGVDGRSVLPILRGQNEDLPVYAETDYRLFVNLRMVRKGSQKLVLDLQDGQKSLYDVSADLDEQNDVSAGQPRATYEMEQALRGWMDTTRTNPQDYLGIHQKPITLF